MTRIPTTRLRSTMRATLCALIVSASPVWAADLDDPIGGDEPIDDTLTSQPNIEFLVISAKAKAKAKTKDQLANEGISSDGVGNINIEAGTDLSGATIINLSDNEGATVVDK